MTTHHCSTCAELRAQVADLEARLNGADQRANAYRRELDEARAAINEASAFTQQSVLRELTKHGLVTGDKYDAAITRAEAAERERDEARQLLDIHPILQQRDAARARAEKAERKADEWQMEARRFEKARTEALMDLKRVSENRAELVDAVTAERERAEKAEAERDSAVEWAERAVNAILDGDSNCTVCERVTANGTCTECHRGQSPLLLARAEAEALKARVGQLTEALQLAKADMFEMGANCSCDDGCANCQRNEEASARIVAALATTDATSWLAERDAKTRAAAYAEAIAELRSGLCNGSECEAHCGFSAWRGCAAVKQAVDDFECAVADTEDALAAAPAKGGV